MATARTTALSALIAARRQGAWSDGVLKEYIARDRLDRRDAALASQLCYGVMQNRLLLDYDLGQVLTGKLKDLQPIVTDILRLGAYQILWMDRVPDSAAVNEAVEQCKRYVNKRASGLVNGVLRSLSGKKHELKAPDSLSVKYSHPQELVELLRESVGERELEPLLAADNAPTPVTIQINPLRAPISEQELTLTPHPWMPGCYYAENLGNVEQLEAFQNGSILIQDPAARLAAEISGVQPGMEVLDVCAAPGGKSFAAAMQMQNRGRITACDIHPHKIDLICKGAQRLGLEIISAQVQDATKENPAFTGRMDVVLADVPCSGLGVIRKKPDIRYKDLEPLARLPEIQAGILETVSGYVNRGGVLLYSTCTILKRENEDIVTAFLQRHPEFSLEAFPAPTQLGQNGGMLTLYPGEQETDGFFIAKLRKTP